MNLRPKTRKRLTILLIAVTAAVSAASTLVIVQLRHYELGRLAYRAQAMEAFQHRDYRTAAADFSKYLSNDRVDPDAIYAFAVCKTKLPRPDLGHLLDAKKLFMRYLELRPGDLDAEHQLLDIYQKLRYPAETMTIADNLLEKNPDDIAALSAKLAQLDRDLKYADALPISLRLNELEPMETRTQIKTVELMAHLRRPPADILARANRLLTTYPDDARFELVRADAAYFTNDLEGTKQWLHTAASATPPDANFVILLAGVFDKLSMWDDSRALLEKAAAIPGAADEIKATLAQRLFELDQFDAALKVLGGVNPQDPGSDSRLLGMTGLLLCTRDHPLPDHLSDRLKGIVITLHKRDDDLIAAAWYSLLEVLTVDSQSDRLQPIRWCQIARRLDPDNPDARFYLGLEYLQLGEGELALQFFRQTAQMQPEWVAPLDMIARILLQRGQAIDAAADAQAACDRNPRSTTAQVTRGLACYQALRPAATGGDIAPLITYIHQLRSIAPQDSQLLAAEIDLLARSNQRSDAIDLATSSLSTSIAQSPKGLWQIELVDQNDHLGLANLITGKVTQINPDTPEKALQQIQIFAGAGKNDLARQRLASMETHRTVEWKIAWLQAREVLGDLNVGSAWETFADSLPHNFDVQNAAMQSPAVHTNRLLMDRTIDRFKSLTGEDALEWKLARARWQLADNDDVKSNATTVAAAMTEVVRTAPQYAAPQILWADALVKLGDSSGAISHLRQAANIDPTNPAISLELAAALLEQGLTQDAISLLNGMVNGSRLTNAQRVETATLYRLAGQPASGIALLRDDQQVHPDDPARDLLLAKLLIERGDQSAGGNIYIAMMQLPQTTPEVVRSAAWFWASRGQMDEARKDLLRLNELPMPAGEKQITLGQFESAFGTPADATSQFKAATKVAPHSPHPWLVWAGFDLRARDFTGAIKLTEQGLKNAPGDASLKAMNERSRTFAGIKLDDQMEPLIDSLADDPASEGGIATLAAIADSQTAHESANTLSDRIAAVIEQNPRYIPALSILVPRDCINGQFDRATKLTTRACELIPVDPEPPRLLTSIASACGHWDSALSAAIQWRDRTLGNPRDADIAIATADIKSDQSDHAIVQLFPYVAPSLSEVEKSGEKQTVDTTVVELYLKALCVADRYSQAKPIAENLAAKSPVWGRRFLQIISVTAKDPASGGEQFGQIEAVLSSTSIEDQLTRGQAWCTLGSRFQDAPSLQKALSIADPLTDGSPVPADAWLLLGTVHQQLNELPQAQTALTKALQVNPDLAVAKNNLATVMWLSKEDLHTAQSLAAAAVAAFPVNSSMHTTLGEIDEQLNDLDAAKLQLEFAVRLDGENAEALIDLASVLDHIGHGGNVTALLQQADAVIRSSHALLPLPVEQELERLHSQRHSSVSTATHPNG